MIDSKVKRNEGFYTSLSCDIFIFQISSFLALTGDYVRRFVG